MATDARLRANAKFRAGHYKQLNIAIPPATMEQLQIAAAAAGLSVRAYVIKAVEARIAADDLKRDPQAAQPPTDTTPAQPTE